MGTQGPSTVAPIGSLTGSSAPQAASFRVPYKWDKNVPKFTTDNHEELLLFVDQVVEILSLANMTEDAVKKEYFTSLLPIRRKNLWRTLPRYISGSFEDFLSEIYKGYPEIKSGHSGSLIRLKKICEDYKGVGADKEGLLRRFGAEFKAEVTKLQRPPALIANVDSVKEYLQTLEPNFARAICAMIGTIHLIEVRFPGLASLASVLPGQPASTRRKEDPIELNELVQIAETMAEQNMESFLLSQPVVSGNEVASNRLKTSESSWGKERLKQEVVQLKRVSKPSYKSDGLRSTETRRAIVSARPGLIEIKQVFGIEDQTETLSFGNSLSRSLRRNLVEQQTKPVQKSGVVTTGYSEDDRAFGSLRNKVKRLQNTSSGASSLNSSKPLENP
ncbi:hypothetical protein C8R43DRAFT_951107 [Mycena crocata]|nr:hypothetical protein C8R43DRAFT_951107 [Mycena crocata]